ncbi:MAG: YraN family protein [Lachnospiraceae bacterium]|nr:YraN family protein [Lachnospiraceae bacterium]
MSTRSKGNRGEDLACSLLEEEGYDICARNYRCKFGEIDIIAYKQNTYVFAEVKYRESSDSGYAEEAVSFAKQRKICAAADHFRMRMQITEQSGFRFDVITINHGEVTHYENAFSYVGRF